jgi:polar amino acid transport system permease protein
VNYAWNFAPVWEHWRAILNGATTTLTLTVLTCVAGTALGIPIALGLASRRLWLRFSSTVAVELCRACPPLVLLLWAYYVLPVMTGHGFSAYITAVICFTAIFASFAADIFRGAIGSIPRATLDSGRALGMDRFTLFKRVTIPEVFRRSLPALNALCVGTLKMSSLASVIAVAELTYSAQWIITVRPKSLEIYTAAAIAYIALIIPLVLLLRFIEGRSWCAVNPISHVGI